MTQKQEIRRQIVLPLGKSAEIAFKSLKVRFFRSLITAGSLSLAVAFLAFVLVNLDVANGFYLHGGEEAALQLRELGYDIAPEAGVYASAKERWIVILSLLVCTVGIINAQLMSVTERFREIGIYKCLGALDSIILRLFLLEACMMGLAGALGGALLGLCFAFANGLVQFGLPALGNLNLLAVCLSLVKAVGAGVILSLIGVFYPALIAARMRPIVALSAEH